MNYITNDKGETVVAIGAPASVARVTVQYPRLIERLNNLYHESCDSPGRAIDKAIDCIREAGIRSELETNSILLASHYRDASLTGLVISVARSNKEVFADFYKQALAECRQAKPADYSWPVSDLDTVARRMIAAFEKGSANYTGAAFRLACKRVGIKPTRKAYQEFVVV